MSDGKRQRVSSGSPYESVIGISRAVRVGGVISVAGTAPLDEEGRTFAPGDAAAQARRCFEIVARARLPLEDMPPTQIVAFRASDDGQEHVALLVGAFGGKPPLVSPHSECLTGDVFGSRKCDCAAARSVSRPRATCQ